jgi:diguanylate cyclase (GGDEF)-like protein/PAS domain S-box-containing protein
MGVELQLGWLLMNKNYSIFKKVFEVTKEGFWIIDNNRRITYVNSALCKMLDYSFDEFIGKTPSDFVDDKNKIIFQEQFSKINITSHSTYSIELQAKDGKSIPTIFAATTVYDQNNQFSCSFAMVTDMREINAMKGALCEANEKLKISENLIRTILDTQENLVVVTDGKRIYHGNSAFLNFFNLASLEELVQTECLCIWSILKPSLHKKEYRCSNWLKEIEESGWRVDGMGKDGKMHNFIVVSNPYPNQDGMHVVTFNDITKLQEEKEFFVHLASTDTLTSLHNRAKLNEILDFMVKKSSRYPEMPFCAIMYDVDYFKNVNDTYGHLAGDFVLKELSQLISKNIRTSDFIARYGGEEFIILLSNTNLEYAIEVTEKLRNLVEKNTFQDLKITCSFGIYQFKQGDTFSSIIDEVDKLLYRAKQNGRNRIEY